MSMLRHLMRFFNPAYISAGLVAVLVGYASAGVIVFQAAEAAGASPEQVKSWLWAIGVGMGVSTIGLSWFYKTPVLIAWSTPGAALLVTSLDGVTLNEAIGLFLFSSALIFLCGITGWFERLMRFLPLSLAGAMLAGVLFRFGVDLFVVMESHLLLVSAMLLAWLLGKKWLPRYVILLVLVTGLMALMLLNQFPEFSLVWVPSAPILMMPEFTLSSMLGVGVPLFIVTMASQNVPGMSTLRAHGYAVSSTPLIATTGLVGLLTAPFGGYAFNLAAITAAICMGKEVDPNPQNRWIATTWGGIFYLLLGVFSSVVAVLIAALPVALIMAVAGIALLGTIGNSLAAALTDESERDAALVTFLVTASGMSLFTVGSAFWGILLGVLVYLFRPQAKLS